MMDHKQLELDFDQPQVGGEERLCRVVDFDTFTLVRHDRLKRQGEQEQARLVAEIVQSVEHITGRTPEAKAM